MVPVAAALVLACLVSCRKEVVVEKVDPLVAAIEAQRGVKALKRCSTFSSGYQATGMGVNKRFKIQKAKFFHQVGTSRLEHVIAYGDLVVLVGGPDRCWRKQGQVVIPCDSVQREHATRLGRLLEASWLWPLKERKEYQVKPETRQHDGKTYDGLSVSFGGQVMGTLLIDPKTSLVMGLTTRTTLLGKTGELVVMFTRLEKVKGIQIATKREYSFAGEPYLTEELIGVMCEKPDQKRIDRPAQVESGHVQLKHKGSSSLACAKIKGPLSGIDAALEKVRGYLAKVELPPVGPPFLVHHRAPPQVKRPAGYVTGVCLPVGREAWVKPKSLWKGEFYLYDDEGDEVLAAFGTGGPAKATAELPGLLRKGAKERGRKRNKESLIQILHMYRPDIPAGEQVSEMHAVLN
jgi:hypothetical protein